jgi:hypothetical protein
MTDTDIEQRLRDLRLTDSPPSGTARQVDTARAWREFRALRSRSTATRRRGLSAAAAAVVAALVISVPLLSGGHHHTGAPLPVTGTSIPGSPRTFPKAVVARIPLSGVVAVVGDAGHAWVIRTAGPPETPAGYQLAGIDLRDNSVMFTKNLGKDLPSVAAGDGRLWITTPYGQGHGQIARLDLATGQVLSAIHLSAAMNHAKAGRCSQISYSAGMLYAACQVRGVRGTGFWNILPVSERGFYLGGIVHGNVSSVVAAPGALWYVRDYTQIEGLAHVTGDTRYVTAHDRGYWNQPPGGQGLVYDGGSIWVLSGGERLTRFDAVTGQTTRVFTYHSYDPKRAGGLDFLTAGDGWLWFLDNGYPFSGVLRVSESNGRPAGGVSIPPNSCGQYVCSQIFYTRGAVWVPTAELLIRIATSRFPS